VTASVGPHSYPLDMRCEIPKRQIAHLGRESREFGGCRLIERNPASQRGFKGATGSPLDVILHERLEESVDLVSDRLRDRQL